MIVSYGYDQGWAQNPSQAMFPGSWEGLVGLWVPSMGNQGDRLWDFSGHRQTAAFISGTNNRWEWSPRGRALWVNGGGNDYLVGPKGLLNAVPAFTFMGWFNQWIMDQTNGFLHRNGGSSTTQIQIETFNDGMLYTEITSETDFGFFDYSTVVTAQKWFHFAVVFDGTQSGNAGRLKMYIDGKSQSLSFTGTIPATTPSAGATASEVWLLNYQTNNQWLGWADDMRLYHRALTQAEISWSMWYSPLTPFVAPIAGKVSAAVPTVSLPFPRNPYQHMIVR